MPKQTMKWHYLKQEDILILDIDVNCELGPSFEMKQAIIVQDWISSPNPLVIISKPLGMELIYAVVNTLHAAKDTHGEQWFVDEVCVGKDTRSVER